MPSAIPTTGTSSVLPPLAAREQTSAKLTELVEAVLRHLQMQGSNKHPTLYHIWDFAMRTDYILSELDNIENGRPLRFPDQIPDLAGCRKYIQTYHLLFTTLVSKRSERQRPGYRRLYLHT
jgi:hypothetical protein